MVAIDGAPTWRKWTRYKRTSRLTGGSWLTSATHSSTLSQLVTAVKYMSAGISGTVSSRNHNLSSDAAVCGSVRDDAGARHWSQSTFRAFTSSASPDILDYNTHATYYSSASFEDFFWWSWNWVTSHQTHISHISDGLNGWNNPTNNVKTLKEDRS